ncbi:MAG: CatB-related O-acetyltransferase [Rhodospirillaceae bacterium]|nr:CatB-related O-acetyltransferase [Rhodospirillaceae bacterium]
MAAGEPIIGEIGNSKIEIGRFTYGYEGIEIRQWGEGASLKIGSFCSIASSVRIFLGGNHRVDWATTFPFGHIFVNELGGEGIKGHPATRGDVVIGNDVWIGHGVTIMSGVSIGSGAVLAANATIVRDVFPYEIVGGNPAKLIRKRFDGNIIDLLMALRWWDLPVDTIRTISGDLSKCPDERRLSDFILKYRS